MVGACPYPAPRGTQVYLRDNALALEERGHEVHLVVYGYGFGKDRHVLKVHRCARIPGTRRKKAGPGWGTPLLDIAMVAALRRVVRKHKIEAVYAHNFEALLAALCAGKRPIIYHAHNAMSDQLPYYLGRSASARRAGRWLDRSFPRRADYVCVPHRRLAGHLIVRGCDHSKVRILPLPVDAADFEPCEYTNELPPVLYAGNLGPHQNLDFLQSAFRHLRKRVPDLRLRIGAPEETQLEGAEAVHTPNEKTLHALLKQDAVFAAPRVAWAGYPINLLKAMAAGLGIVACHSAAYPITHEHNGLIVPDNDEAAFSEAIERLATDHRLRAQLGRNARETIANEHAPDRVAEQLEAITEEAIRARGPS